MLNNHIKIAWRNLTKNKGYSILNIAGLSAGMAVTLLIALWVVNEFSYDKFLPNYNQLYKVQVTGTSNGITKTGDYIPLPLADVLRKEIPGIKLVAESGRSSEHSLIAGDKKITKRGAVVGDDFLKMFQYPLMKGNAATVLKDPYSIVLTASTAKALYGDKDPINKVIRVDNEHDFKVTGVMQDLPENSSLQFHYLIPFSFLYQTNSWVKSIRNDWYDCSFQLLVELQPNVSYEQVSAKIKNLIYKHAPKIPSFKPELMLHPLKDWRLYSEFKNGKSAGGYIDYVYMFCSIGILVLIL